jgi:2-isopropylmalate synthase
MNDQVSIFDTTLRDGEQAPGASMTIPEKVRLAGQLADLGVDVIEAGFPISSPAQRKAVRRIIDETSGSTVCALSRTREDDVRAAGEALEGGDDTRIHTFVATSDVHIGAKFDDDRFGATLAEKREAIVQMARDAVQQARTYTDDVEFSAEDAGRTDRGFLREIVRAAIEAGATTVNIPDTTGYCTPDEYAALFETVRESLDNPGGVTFSTHCHDDLGLATANSLAGVRAGARQIECTINGIGERAGNAALEEVVMALDVRADALGVSTGINTELLTETSQMVSVCSGFPVQPNKAIVGKNAFSHEAGIHQHGVLKERETYEIMRAEDVGQDVEQIRLGRHSGRHGLFDRLDKLGIDVPEGQKEAVYQKFTELADQKKEIFEADLHRLVETPDVHTVTTHYELDRMKASVETEQEPAAFARVRHRRDGLTRAAHATGDGPVDALYRAIDHAVDEAHSLIDFTIHAESEGADALGEVSVVISNGANHFSGEAVSPDVLRASAEAYIDALNHMAAFHADEESRQFVSDGIMEAFG